MTLWQDDEDDETIERRVLEELSWDDRIDASDVTVEVEGGMVRLSGTVPTLPERRAAVQTAWTVLGVRGVEDGLFVETPEDPPPPGDGRLRQHVEQVLDWTSTIDGSNIQVSVEGGTVDLRGSVDAFWKKGQVENLVSHLAGVRFIDNELVVVPEDDSPEDILTAEEMMEAIHRRGGESVEDVEISVEDGVVTLDGVVPDIWTYRWVLDLVERTSRVKHVVDDIEVSR